jgi:adenosine deaminase
MLAREFPALRDALRAVPKAEIHLHLDGSIRTQTIIELAAEQSVSLPTDDPAELDRILQPGPDCQSLEEYLAAFGITTSVLGTASALERISYELCLDLHDDNISYAEIRYSPLFMTSRGLTLDEAVLAVERGLERGEKETGIVTRQLICAMRNEAGDVSRDVAACAARLVGTTRVVGFDLAGPEAGYPPSDHQEAYTDARLGLLRSTVHAGEAAGPASVLSALVHCGAERLGHGVALREDDALRAYVRDRGITVEVCVTSNLQTKAVKDVPDHPVVDFLREGLSVAVCVDNLAVSATTVTEELALIAEHHDITIAELRALVAGGFDAAFLPPAEKSALRDRALAVFDATFTA